jgi:hypothetical protein
MSNEITHTGWKNMVHEGWSHLLHEGSHIIPLMLTRCDPLLLMESDPPLHRPASASPTKLKTQKLEGAACFPIELTRLKSLQGGADTPLAYKILCVRFTLFVPNGCSALPPGRNRRFHHHLPARPGQYPEWALPGLEDGRVRALPHLQRGLYRLPGQQCLTHRHWRNRYAGCDRNHLSLDQVPSAPRISPAR